MRMVLGTTARRSPTLMRVCQTVSSPFSRHERLCSVVPMLEPMGLLTDFACNTGVHTDSKGNVYAGCNDGVHVWNPSGKLIGKIYTGTVAANFQFAGDGRMVITGQTKLFYATLAASGVALT